MKRIVIDKKKQAEFYDWLKKQPSPEPVKRIGCPHCGRKRCKVGVK
jgi:hypothetical protein